MTSWPRTPRAFILVAEVGFVMAIAAIGAVLNHRGVPIHAGAAPLAGYWHPHIGIGTPLAVGVAVLVIWCGWSASVAAWSWWRTATTAYGAALAWTFSLALIDGWHHGIVHRVSGTDSYLQDAGRVDDVHRMLATFTTHILAREPGSWPTDVAGHPPGALLVFVFLHRIGLAGGAAAGVACIVVGALAPVCVAITLRALGSEATARAALPFLVLFPGAVWVGTTADGLFMGVAAAGVALVAVRGWWRAALGGVLLGYSLYLSYGLVLFGLVALAAIRLKPADRPRTLFAASVGALLVVVTFTAYGFSWIAGYHLVKRRYFQGWGAERPYAYWIWADLAALVASVGFVLWPAIWLAMSSAVGRMRGREQSDAVGAELPLVVLPLAALVGVIAADLSGLSKGEVERIWLPFAIWPVAAAALLPSRRSWLIGQAILALTVNSFILTAW